MVIPGREQNRKPVPEAEGAFRHLPLTSMALHECLESLIPCHASMEVLDESRIEPHGAVPRPGSGARFLFYSHDGMGLGHTRRHLAVARALIKLAPDSSVLMATGSEIVSRLGLTPRIDILKLPGLRKVANEEYAARRLQIPGSEIRTLRSALLHAAIKAYRPAVVLVDKHPFGAKGELRAGLAELRSAGGCCVLGLRDILDEPANVLKESAADQIWERVAEAYELVLIYGDRAIFDPVTEYQFPGNLARRTRFCGYVVDPDGSNPATETRWTEAAWPRSSRPRVMATTGGGEDGFFLLETFMRAAEVANWEGIAVAGPMSPELETLQRLAARTNVTMHTFVPDLSQLFGSVDALVCMGGYNTLAEAVSKGVPTICVPRTVPRREQLIRARAFERLGLLSVIEPEKLTPSTLGRVVQSVISTSRSNVSHQDGSPLRFDGAWQTARQLLRLSGMGGLPVRAVTGRACASAPWWPEPLGRSRGIP